MRSRSEYPVAPELAISRWFNTTASPTLADLRGEVVVMEAFQMLCPGCVSHGLPQAMRIQQVFGDTLTVLGLHCVFEHHEAMTPVSLEAFLYEYRITFPMSGEAHDGRSRLPIIMGRYQLRGTPSLVVVDRAGRLGLTAFGQIDDLAVGATLALLMDEPRPQTGGRRRLRQGPAPSAERIPSRPAISTARHRPHQNRDDRSDSGRNP